MTTSDTTGAGVPAQYVPEVTSAVSDELAARASQLLGPTDPRLRERLPAELEILRDWPDRVALIVGSAPPEQLLAVLRRRRLTPISASAGTAIAAAAGIGPFVLLLLMPDALGEEDDIERVRALHRVSPSARCLLVARDDQQTATLLRRALRAGVSEVVNPDDQLEIERLVGGGLISAGYARERVLAIGAHPDDVEIGCCGTLLDHRRRGDRITILTLSRGAVGGSTDDRAAEASSTAAAIGAQLLLADLPDTRISEGIDTIALIESVVRAIDPTVVYVHSLHDNHQDHRAVHIATVSATRGVRRVFAYQSPSATNSFLPSQFVSIDEVIERKVRILDMFGSQSGRTYLEPEMVTSGARYWARHLAASARYAEPFEVVRSVGDLRQLAAAPVAALDRAPLAVIADLIPRELMAVEA